MEKTQDAVSALQELEDCRRTPQQMLFSNLILEKHEKEATNLNCPLKNLNT